MKAERKDYNQLCLQNLFYLIGIVQDPILSHILPELILHPNNCHLAQRTSRISQASR